MVQVRSYTLEQNVLPSLQKRDFPLQRNKIWLKKIRVQTQTDVIQNSYNYYQLTTFYLLCRITEEQTELTEDIQYSTEEVGNL